MKHKTLDRIEIKQQDGEPTGEIAAVIATFNAVDHDGDVVVPGAFTEGERVRLSAYNHASWGPGELPVGKGEIRTTDTEAQFHGHFFMATEAGRETFEVVKEMAELQEYSWGFDVLEADRGQMDGEPVQFLRALKVHEVSPVLLGASIGTRTLAVKGDERPECEAIKARAAQLTGADAAELSDPGEDEGLRDYDKRLEVEAVEKALLPDDPDDEAKQLSNDLYRRLDDAGTERFGGDEIYVYVDDFDLDEGFVVFSVCSDTDRRYVRVPYMRGADGSVALGPEQTEVERTTSYEPKGTEPEGRKLADHLDEAIASLEEVTERVASAVAQRAEKGQKLAEATLQRASQLKSEIERLQEALATEPQHDEPADAWDEGLEIEDRLLRARR